MISDSFNLLELYPLLPKMDQEPPMLDLYCRSSTESNATKRYPAMLILPGGGYRFCSDREGEPIALALLARGIQCFVLRYRTNPARFPNPLNETAAAVHFIRTHAEEYQVDPNFIGVMGFSAGGHLTGTYCTHWHEGDFAKAIGVEDNELLKPNGMGLCYAVLRKDLMAYGLCMQNLLEEFNEEDNDYMSCADHVTEYAPPAFFFHTTADQLVDVRNPLVMAEALSLHNIPYEMHIYPEGGHGLALSNWLTAGNDPNQQPAGYINAWIPALAAWWLRIAGLGFAEQR